MRITLSTGGVSRQVLHEIKCISSSQSRYKPSWADRGVDRRADQLHQEYVVKARKADQEHGGVPQGVVGAVERKLQSYPKVEGIVFGNWGEASKATHQLVEELASSRARIADPQTRGRCGQILSEEGIKGLAVGYIRRSCKSPESLPAWQTGRSRTWSHSCSWKEEDCHGAGEGLGQGKESPEPCC